MCPACLSTVALVAAGAGSTSGVTALLVKKLRGLASSKDADSTKPENDEKEDPR